MPCRWLSGAPILDDKLSPVVHDVGLIKDPGVCLLSLYLHAAAVFAGTSAGASADPEISISLGNHFTDNSL